MKNTQKRFADVAVKVARAAMVRDANQTTCNIIFQPKIPAGLSKFKKAER